MSNPTPFQQWLNFVWQPQFDGGGGYHVTPHDSGGGTLLGVTETTWADAAQRGLVHGALRDATHDDCALILKRNFWDPCQCDRLHPAPAGILFNMAMSDGPYRARCLAQDAVRVAVDGIFGPMTMAQLTATEPGALIDALTADQENFTDHLQSAQWFGRGWRNRAEAAAALAHKMLGR